MDDTSKAVTGGSLIKRPPRGRGWAMFLAVWPLLSLPAVAAPLPTHQEWSAGESRPMLLADASKKKSTKSRARNISGEATLKSKDQSKLDFDAADIGGERKAPMGNLIQQNKADKNYDFVKIRLRWHPEMVQSASALDAGANGK